MKKVKIAHCDDQEFARVNLQRLAKAFGFDLESFASGEELLRRLRAVATGVPNVIITDNQMDDGKMTGLDLVREIRNDPALAGILIIVFATSPVADFARQVEAAGAIFIEKKSIRELLARLQQL